MTRHEFKVGDFARNVESGWLGRIEEIQAPETVTVDEKTSFVETMVRMVGVDELALTVGGGTVAKYQRKRRAMVQYGGPDTCARSSDTDHDSNNSK